MEISSHSLYQNIGVQTSVSSYITFKNSYTPSSEFIKKITVLDAVIKKITVLDVSKKIHMTDRTFMFCPPLKIILFYSLSQFFNSCQSSVIFFFFSFYLYLLLKQAQFSLTADQCQ